MMRQGKNTKFNKELEKVKDMKKRHIVYDANKFLEILSTLQAGDSVHLMESGINYWTGTTDGKIITIKREGESATCPFALECGEYSKDTNLCDHETPLHRAAQCVSFLVMSKGNRVFDNTAYLVYRKEAIS